MISIDWETYIIYIPKDYMTLVQSTPTEIRELPINQFRLDLKSIEDNEDGIVEPDTHIHYPSVTVGGVELAMVVNILSPYSCEFEDGQYAVNLTGANSNIADVVNVNQVSVRSGNSAGLISSRAIEFSSFNGGVSVDVTSNNEGTTYPIGTVRAPVNNMSDALLIAKYRGFTKFFVIKDLTLGETLNLSKYSFEGESPNKSTIIIQPDVNVIGSEFYSSTVTGTLDGGNILNRCVTKDLNYVNGYIWQNGLQKGIITLGGGVSAFFIDCWAGETFEYSPVIDMGGFGQTLVMQNLNGYLKIQNKTGPEDLNFSLNAGWIILDDTVISGTVNLVGIGVLQDKYGNNISTGIWNGGVVVNNDCLISKSTISNAIWDEDVNLHNTFDTYGKYVSDTYSNVVRALGLAQENQYLDQTVYASYQGVKLLTSGRIRTYSIAGSVGTDSDVIATYQITTTWNNDEMTSYKVVKV